jgi:D-alanyl-D-alanine carboxypeptidase
MSARALVCLMWLGFPVGAQPAGIPAPQFAPAPVTGEFARFLAAFNSGDRGILTAYAREYGSDEFNQPQSIRRTLGMYKAWGGLDVLEIDDASPHAIRAWVRAQDADDVMSLEFEVSPEPPYRLKTFRLPEASAPANYLPSRIDTATAATSWRADVARRAAADKFSGAILFAEGGRVFVRDAFGYADRERKIRNGVDTRFRTASVTKMFTAVAVLRLVQDGRIHLDDPLGRHVPELADQPLGRGTVHQYLNHTSGAGDLDHRWFEHQRELRTHDDYLAVFRKDALGTEPGTGYAYSNLGYMLLGTLIERVSDRSYYDVVHRTVFSRARMKRTGTEPEDVDVEGRSIVYERPLGTHEIVSAIDHLDYRPVAAAGVYTTIDDLARFFDALRKRELLDAKHTGLMMTPTARAHHGRSYAYGLQVREGADGTWLGHDGVDRGMNAEAWISPETGRVLIVLANLDLPAAEQVANRLKARLLIH